MQFKNNNMINVIVAVSHNWVIGSNNKLPWKIKSELNYFKSITKEYDLLMGRKTFNSLPKILPNRHHSPAFPAGPEFHYKYVHPQVTVINDFEALLLKYQGSKTKHIFILGGEEIFKLTINFWEYLYISFIKKKYNGNRHFPKISLSKQELVYKKEYPEFISFCYKIKK